MYNITDVCEALHDVGHGIWVLMIWVCSVIIFGIGYVFEELIRDPVKILTGIAVLVTVLVTVPGIVILAWLII